MRGLKLRARARADLVDIRLYTLERYNARQADDYLRGLAGRLQELREHPLMGRAELELGENIRSFPYQRHRIYYEVSDELMEVLRVFHHAQTVIGLDHE